MMGLNKMKWIGKINNKKEITSFCVFKFESGSFYGGQVFNGKFHDRLKTGSTLFCMGIYNNLDYSRHSRESV